MLQAILSFLNFKTMFNRQEPTMKVELPCSEVKDWKIVYSRHGSYYVMGWINGAWAISSEIKSIVGNNILVDVCNRRFKVEQNTKDEGEWAYSLRLRYPLIWEALHEAGIIQQ